MWRLRVGVGLSVLMTVAAGIAAAPQSRPPRAPHAVIAWDDIPLTLRPLLEQRDLSSASFPAFITRVRSTTMARVREGQLDHVIFYALQSTHFTTLPPMPIPYRFHSPASPSRSSGGWRRC